MSNRRPRNLPLPLVIPGLVAVAFLALPLLVLLVQTPWSDFPDIVQSPTVVTALRLSLGTSLAATAIAAVFGVPLAWLLARDALPATALVRALVIVPLLLPPVVSGVALLVALGRRGLAGAVLFDAFGWQLPFTTAGVIVAEAFVAMPFLIITLEGGFRAGNRRYEEAARTLGATPWLVFRRISLPLVMPSLVAGLVLTWARALGEFGATMTFAGNFPGVTQTMPLAVYQALETDRSAAIAMSVLLLVVSVSVLVALRGRYTNAGAA